MPLDLLSCQSHIYLLMATHRILAVSLFQRCGLRDANKKYLPQQGYILGFLLFLAHLDKLLLPAVSGLSVLYYVQKCNKDLVILSCLEGMDML